MGERVMFGFQDRQNNIIFLYSHWGGGTHVEDLAIAIEKAENRHDDDGYATRIAISSLVGSNWDQEFGFGLYSNGDIDTEYETQIVVWHERMVYLYDVYNPPQCVTSKRSFKEYEDYLRAGYIPAEAID